MKIIGKQFAYFGVMCLCIAIYSHLMAGSSFAAEKAGSWRGTYDVIMLWVNFFILAFILVRYTKTPIMNFLRGRKDELAREINRMEEGKEKIISKIQETFKTLEESDQRFADMKERIVEQGEKRKKEIIEEAQQQSAIMMEMAKRKVEGYISQAKSDFKSELIDSAISLALEKLPEEITDEDNDRFISQYMEKTLP